MQKEKFVSIVCVFFVAKARSKMCRNAMWIVQFTA